MSKVLERAQDAVGPEDPVCVAFPAMVGVVRPDVVIGLLAIVFVATGIGFGALPVLLLFFVLWKYRVVAVTESSVVIFAATFWRPGTPRQVLARLPREGTMKTGSALLWQEIVLDGRRFWVSRRYGTDVVTPAGTKPPGSRRRPHGETQVQG
jgi:hypothetical protein